MKNLMTIVQEKTKYYTGSESRRLEEIKLFLSVSTHQTLREILNFL